MSFAAMRPKSARWPRPWGVAGPAWAKPMAEVAVTINAGKFPPEVTVQPKVLQSRVELKRFELNRLGPVLLGNKEAHDLGDELKGSLQELLKQYEPQVTEKANEAIAQGLKDGKAKLSAETLLKLNLPAEPKR